VWTSIFEPLPTFGFLDKMGRQNEWGKRHALPYHVVGSDAAAVVVRVGSAVRNWKPGDRVTVHCNYVDDQDPSAHNDSMLATNQLIWGFETNFGGLADLAVGDWVLLRDPKAPGDVLAVERLDAGPGDAGDPQCDGMPDFTACDDGRAWTLDGCIGGVCVGRVCSDNQVPRNCNTAVLTLTSCEGMPFEDGTVCDDGDPFTTNTTCTAGACGGGDPCPCPPGEPCCYDNCTFRPMGSSCDLWVEVDCVGGEGCGTSYQQIVHETECTGDSAACDGLEETRTGAPWPCAEDLYCTNGSYVPPNSDGRDVTFGCVPRPSC
jgi:hypothetical protein